jgi:hypothetical protein
MQTEKIISLISIFILLGFLIQSSSSFAAEKLEKMTKEQYEKLPDTAIIDVKGRQITKGQYRSEIKQKRELAKARPATSSEAKANFEAARAQFLKDEKAQLDTHNARVNAEFERLRQKSAESSSRLKSIQDEANQLSIRSRTASPSERAQIDKRAGELLQQIKQLGY